MVETEALFSAVLDATAGRGADAVIDAALLDQLALPAVRDGGQVATVRGFQGTQERGTTCHPVLVRSYAREQAKLDQLRQLAEDGQLTLRVAATLPAVTPDFTCRENSAQDGTRRFLSTFA